MVGCVCATSGRMPLPNYRVKQQNLNRSTVENGLGYGFKVQRVLEKGFGYPDLALANRDGGNWPNTALLRDETSQTTW